MMTLVISGFPGIGKTTYKNSATETTVLDSDSSHFPKDNFPQNYIDYIKSNIGTADVILVSSHAAVREALIENKIPYTLVVPDIDLLEEYKERYARRGSSPLFIELLETNWKDWLSNQKDEHVIVLGSGEYLSDAIARGQK